MGIQARRAAYAGIQADRRSGRIAPGVLMDNDGSANLFWARGCITVAKLKDNLVEWEAKPLAIANNSDSIGKSLTPHWLLCQMVCMTSLLCRRETLI